MLRGEGGGSTEIELKVGPLMDAIEKQLQYAEVFGPLLSLATKNDEGNLRKARKVWRPPPPPRLPPTVPVPPRPRPPCTVPTCSLPLTLTPHSPRPSPPILAPWFLLACPLQNLRRPRGPAVRATTRLPERLPPAPTPSLQVWEKAKEESRKVVTLRQLLETEKATGVHKPGGVLADPSAAIALLWMRRTLQFLQGCMQGIVDKGDDPTGGLGDVVRTAYMTHLEPYHGWLLKNTFTVALAGTPRRDEVMSRIGVGLNELERDRICESEMRDCIAMTTKVSDAMRRLFEELDLEDTRKV